MNWAEKEFTTAYSFRKYVQKNLLDAFQTIPEKNSVQHRDKDIRISKEIINDLKKDLGFESTPLEWLWRVSEGGEIGNQAMKEFPIDHDYNLTYVHVQGYTFYVFHHFYK